MNLYDVVIVGSGASGVAASLGLKGLKVLMLDVGYSPREPEKLSGNLYDLKRNDPTLKDKIIGPNFESLNNIAYPYLNPKLKSPLNRFITKNANSLTPIAGDTFLPRYSFAKGGMANAWGAGAYEFQDFELKDFPISFEEISPFYTKLTEHIGISGVRMDDLTHYLGRNEKLQKPANMAKISSKLYRKYLSKKEKFHLNNFYMGNLRQAILTKDLGDRKKTDYSNLEFYRPYISSIYNPAFTLDQLIQSGSINYTQGVYVEEYKEEQGICIIKSRDLSTNVEKIFKSKKLILAAGPINTSKIVLRSNHDYITQLPLQENAISYIPFVDLLSIGKATEKESVPASLGLVYWPNDTEPTWISLYCLGGPLKSEYIMDFPLSAKGCLSAGKYFPSAMMIAQVFYPGDKNPNNWLKLNTNGQVEFNFHNRARGEIERKIIETFRSLGFLSHISLCKMPEAGNSFHYGCTLPMKENPQRYQCNRNGLLHGTDNIYIADSSNFSFLPAKNLTFSMMANAMRIGEVVKKTLVTNSPLCDSN